MSESPIDVTWDLLDPIGDSMASFLLSRKHETAEYDFKHTLRVDSGADFAKVAKDIFAFSNCGGGYLVIGFAEKPTGGYEPVGLPDNFHIDQAQLQEKFNAYSTIPLSISYREVKAPIGTSERKFAIVYVPPAPTVVKPVRDGKYVDSQGREHLAIKTGTVYTRRGTQSVPASSDELVRIESRLKRAGYRISLVSGEADSEPEDLVLDLFEVTSSPRHVTSALLVKDFPEAWEPDISAWVVHGDRLYSFDDLARSSIRAVLSSDSVVTTDFTNFSSQEEGSRIVSELLRWEVYGKAARGGMRVDHRRGRIFYPLEPGHDQRLVHWAGLARQTKRTVARRIFSTVLHGEVCFHLAVSPEFVRIGDSLFLRLESVFLLTREGKSPIYGPEQGRLLTSFENSVTNFNLGYLRSVLFWAGQLAEESDRMSIRPDLVISSSPVRIRAPKGIRSDQVGLQRITGEEPLHDVLGAEASE